MKLVQDSDEALKEVVELWTAAMMDHMTAATKADARVKYRIKRIRQLYTNHDESQLRNKMKVDWDLHDALDSYRNHCTEVQRYSSAIQALSAAQSFLANVPTV